LANFVDVWDVDTFDDDLLKVLLAKRGLVHDYLTTDHERELERETSPLTALFRINPFADEHQRFVDSVSQTMHERSIRAWHYTRLTDGEVATLQTAGIHLSTLESTRQRLAALVAVGELSVENAEALLTESPLHDRQQHDARANQFCLACEPLHVESGGVTPLLGSWGGEVVYSHLKSPQLKTIVEAIGRPRVLELQVPVDAIRNGRRAGEVVVTSFARSLGDTRDFDSFDVFVNRALGPEAVLAIHTKGDATFDRIGRSYPIAWRPRESS